jgi:Tim17/Tim22/Tim23/Pmp24 family
MGFLFGMFLGAMGDMQPISMINGREVPQPPLREQVHDLEVRMVMLSREADSVLVVCVYDQHSALLKYMYTSDTALWHFIVAYNKLLQCCVCCYNAQARAAYLSTATRSLGLARNFASFSAIFMGSECVIEKMRGKHGK